MRARILLLAAALGACGDGSNADEAAIQQLLPDGTLATAGSTGDDVECRMLVETWGGPTLPGYTPLTLQEVQQVVVQAVEQAIHNGALATVAVVDREGFVLGVWQMAGAPAGPAFPVPATMDPSGAPGINDAIVKARTAAFLSSNEEAFTSRTAAFIVGSHFPPGVRFTPGGPLFGVQNSSDTGSDVIIDPNAIGNNATPLPNPNGLTGALGGLPLYKDRRLVGAVGVSSTVADMDETVAIAGTRGFAAPHDIRACEIFIDGVRLPFHMSAGPIVVPTLSIATIPGAPAIAPAAGTPLAVLPFSTMGGVTGELWYPIVASPVSALTAADVMTIIANAANTARQTRAGIRRPQGTAAQVWISVVDTAGNILGVFRTPDATLFSFDVAVQKARTSVAYSDGIATAALGEPIAGVPLGTAVTTRAVGFMSQDFYPPGIDGSPPGPLFGLQDALPGGRGAGIVGLDITPGVAGDATDGNGITIFPGGIPLYKGGVLVGAIGISGDGVDQDDFISAAGTVGFEPPASIRCDQFFVNGARLPYVKFPRNPTEGVR